MRFPVPARVAVTAWIAFAACVASAAAESLQPVRLPRDQGAHPGFSVEWWYTMGHATGANGRRYFWFATIWAAPGGGVGRVNVVDLERDKIVLAKQWTRTGPFAAGARDLDAGGLRLRWLASGELGRVTVHARVDQADALRLELVPKRRYTRCTVITASFSRARAARRRTTRRRAWSRRARCAWAGARGDSAALPGSTTSGETSLACRARCVGTGSRASSTTAAT
jgi:hypothetical protein